MMKQLCLLYILLFAIIGATAYTVGHLPSDQRPAEGEYMYEALQDQYPSDTAARDLTAVNEDYRGWLRIPDTPISHPVVSGRDNAFYLSHSFYGERSQYGCLFFDVRSTAAARSRVIYGHNMGRGRAEMFSALVNYQDRSYADSHKQIFFTDPAGYESVYEVFAIVNFDTARIDQWDYRTPSFKTKEEYASFVSKMRHNSVCDMGYKPDNEDLLILSTCNNAYGRTNRLLICAGKIR